MRRWTAILIVNAGLALSAAGAEERAVPSSPAARDSYSVGYAFADGLKTQEVEIEEEVLIQAVRDGHAGRAPLLSADEMRSTLLGLRKKGMAVTDRRMRERAAKNLAVGQAFLEKNKAEAGVTVLPSGLQYAILREGDGPRPKADDTVKVRYRGTLIDGTEFDSSEKHPGPAIMRVDGVIKGWTEALQLMKVGSRWRIVVPPDLAYGERSFGRIPANGTLVFELELLSIEKGPAGSGKAPVSQAK
jgi:FKBP-type peptidyl-prolyl cis-trans isomerase FklB